MLSEPPEPLRVAVAERGGHVTVESWGIVLVVLAAVLVGAAIPALVQARATLRSLERVLQRSGKGLDEALGAATVAAGRIDRLAMRLEEGGRIEQLVDGVAAASRSVAQLQHSLRIASAVGAAVGPAIAAAVHALRDPHQEGEGAAQPRPAPEVEPLQPEQGKQAMS